MFRPQKILVTGGCGFVGHHLVRTLVEDHRISVVNVDKLSYAANPEALSDLTDEPNYTFERVDLCKPAALSAVFATHRPDAVIHLAAESHVDRSIADPDAFIQTNLVGSYHLLQASLAYWRSLPQAAAACAETATAPLSQEGFRFLHVSTDEVYGSLPADAPCFCEHSPYDPHSPYSASKAGADHLVRAWHATYGLPVLIGHPCNLFGPGQYPEKLIPRVLRNCLRGEPIPIYGDGTQRREWLYVKDCVDALFTVLMKGRVGESYNIGEGTAQRNIDLVRTLCRCLDALAPELASKAAAHTNPPFADLIRWVADRPGHDTRYALDSSKLREELGWAPRHAFEESLHDTVAWYLAQRSWLESRT
jgi:dTDP-glucose 4,6-dehydratase